MNPKDNQVKYQSLPIEEDENENDYDNDNAEERTSSELIHKEINSSQFLRTLLCNFCIGYLMLFIFSILIVVIWSFVLPQPTLSTIYEDIPCTFSDCVIKYDGDVCVIEFINSTTISSCVYHGCQENPEYVKCDYDKKDKCPTIDCMKVNNEETFRRTISTIFLFFACIIIIFLCLFLTIGLIFFSKGNKK